MLLIITDALVKIENGYEYSNYILVSGMILKIISFISIVAALKKHVKF